MFFLRLAVLNVLRNRGRSIVTIVSTAVGIAALIFMSSYNYGSIEDAYQRMISMSAGHVQIHAHGFESNLEPSLIIKQKDRVLDICKPSSVVRAVCTRVKSEAVVTADEQSAPVTLYGVDPQSEPYVTQVDRKILAGHYFSSNGERELLIGDSLAKQLKVELGSDRLVIMTQAADGTATGAAFRVQGIYHAGARELDERTIYTTEASVQKLLGIGSGIHEIVVLLKDREETPKFCLWLKQKLNEIGDYDITPWYDVMAVPVQGTKFYLKLMGIIFIVVTVLIAAGIMNTMLMSVIERVKELGVMLALGTSPKQLVQLVLLESVVLQFIGMMVGLGIGLTLVAYFGEVGIVQKGLEKAMEEDYASITTYPHVRLIDLLQSLWMLTIISLIVNLYPAWRAARISPLEATRDQ